MRFCIDNTHIPAEGHWAAVTFKTPVPEAVPSPNFVDPDIRTTYIAFANEQELKEWESAPCGPRFNYVIIWAEPKTIGQA